MGANTMTNTMTTDIVRDGEHADAAYWRLYGDQVRPCDFRRWFTIIRRGDACTEIDAETGETIGGYIADQMTVDEAFSEHCPDYVGPGVFSVAWRKERLRLIAAPDPVADVSIEPVVEVVAPETEETSTEES